MNNYPNMSYCMCNNTLAALEQILDHMDSEGDIDFVRYLSITERKAFEDLMHVAKQFARRSERAIEEEWKGIVEEEEV